MRALVLQGPWQIGVEERPDPVPGPRDARLQVIATGICGSDLHGYTGENGRRSPGQVMGHETVARVAELGSAVDPAEGVAPGALVTFNPVIGCGTCEACLRHQTQQCATRQVIGVTPEILAGMAEYTTVPVANLVPLPATLQPELGALVEPLAVGYHAARRGQVDAADPRSGDLAARTREHLGGPADVVFDAVGASATVADALNCSALGARIVLVGMNAPTVELAAYALTTNERSLVGSFCYDTEDFSSTARWVADEGSRLASLVDGSTDLDGASETFRRLADGSMKASKILIFPHGTDTEEPGR